MLCYTKQYIFDDGKCIFSVCYAKDHEQQAFYLKKIMITSVLCPGVYSGVRRFLITPTL
jgi:hypothetical protein